MLPTAHIASAMALDRLLRLDATGAAICGATLPDAIDKALSWVFGLAPAPRHIAHTLLTGAVLSAATFTLLGRRRGMAFCGAYLIHLIEDLWDRGHVPWLMPFKSYDVRTQPWKLNLSPGVIFLEAVGAVTIVWLVRDPQSDGSNHEGPWGESETCLFRLMKSTGPAVGRAVE